MPNNRGMQHNEAVLRAIEKAGSIKALASGLEVSSPTVHEWKVGGRKVPAERCPQIEALTGVRCEDLRPDVAWAVLRQSAPAPETPAPTAIELIALPTRDPLPSPPPDRVERRLAQGV